jgi:hypothetical protein
MLCRELTWRGVMPISPRFPASHNVHHHTAFSCYNKTYYDETSYNK